MKKLLVLMLVVGMVCLAGAAFAQIGDADNGGSNQDTGGGTGVQVTNPNIAGATAGSGDGTTNLDGDQNGTVVSVPNANIAGADANGDSSIAVDADAAAQDGSVAQDGDTNVNVPDPHVALSGKQAGTDGATLSDDSASALLAKQVGSGGSTQTDDSANALLAKQVGATGAINTDSSTNANALGDAANEDSTVGSVDGTGSAGAQNGSTAQTSTAGPNQNGGLNQNGTTNVSVPDATVQALGKNMADDGSYVTDDSGSALFAKQVAGGSAQNTDDSANALGTANSGDGGNAQTAGAAANSGEALNQGGNTTIPVIIPVRTAAGLEGTDENSDAGLSSAAVMQPFDDGGDSFNNANNGATGGSTALGGVDNNNTLITDPQVALGGKMAATGTGTNQDNSINNFGASQATGASSSVGFQTPITNVYPTMVYDKQAAPALTQDGSAIPIGLGGGTTQVGAAGGSMAFGGFEDTGVIGTGNITQGGSENVNMNNISSSPVQYRETNGSTGVAMDSATANTTTGENSPIATDQAVSQGGEHNVNVAVTDPALQFGDANAYANNGSTALAVGDDSALATDTGKAQSGYANAMDSGIAQDGQTNMNNLTSSPVQVRNANDNYGAMAMDSGMAQKGFINSQAQNDAQSQVGLLNSQAKDSANAQTGLNNMNNVTSSPVQIRGTEVDDGAVAMDSGVAFGKNEDGQQANNGNNQYIGDDAYGVQGNDNAKGINFTQNATPSSSKDNKGGGIPERFGSIGQDGSGSAVDPSVVQADVGAIDSDHIQGGYDNQNAMDNGMNLKDVDDSAVSYNGNAMTQDVDKGSIGNQVVAGDSSPVQVRSLGEVKDSALAMDSGKAQSIADESIGVQSMDSGVSQLGLTNANTGQAQTGVTNAQNNGQAQTGLLNTQANSGNAQTGLTNANTGQAQTGLLNNQTTTGNAQMGLTNANTGVAQTGLANNNGGATTNGQLVLGDGVGIQTGDNSPVQNRDTEAKDYSVVTMDSGVSLGGKENFNTYAGDNSPVQARYNDVDDGSAVAQDTGIAISKPEDSPVAINGSKAIGSVEDDAAVGMDSARVISEPDDSAIAQGDGGVALNDTDHFAVATGSNSPAIQDNDGNIAFVGAGNSAQTGDDSAVNQASNGMANRQVGLQNAAVNGSGQSVNQAGLVNSANNGSGQSVIQGGLVNTNANAVTGDNSPVQQRSVNAAAGAAVGMDSSTVQNQTITNNQTPVAANQGSGIANNGTMGAATVTDTTPITVNPVMTNTNPNEPSNGQIIQGINTIAVTQLKQVNAGVSIGNNNNFYGSGAQVNANSSGSSTTGVYSSSGSIGTASNSASMNVVNVSANITQRTGQ